MASFPQDLPAGASLSPPSVALSEPGWVKKSSSPSDFCSPASFEHLFLGLGAAWYVVQTIDAKSKAPFTAASVPAVSAASREHKKLADLPEAAEVRRRFRTLGAG